MKWCDLLLNSSSATHTYSEAMPHVSIVERNNIALTLYVKKLIGIVHNN